MEHRIYADFLTRCDEMVHKPGMILILDLRERAALRDGPWNCATLSLFRHPINLHVRWHFC